MGLTRTVALASVMVLPLAPTAAAASPTGAVAPAEIPGVSVATDLAIYSVAEGGVASVGVTVTTPDGAPLGTDAVVEYATAAELTPASGTVTFPAGSASGSTQLISLAVPLDGEAETAQAVELTVADQIATIVVNANGFPYLDSRRSIDQRVADLLERMTLEEKIGQMTQAERAAVFGEPSLIAQWRLGSVLSGGGSTPPENTPRSMAGSDQLVPGPGPGPGHTTADPAHLRRRRRSWPRQRVRRAIVPHNIGLGSTRDRRLVEEIGGATAAEIRATGIPWNFSPCLWVGRDERWGRTYESFGESREVAPDATVTYSVDASAPMDHADVGIVVVGETTYAEGSGDVDGLECGWCSLPQQEEKSLSLQPGDKAVIDTVCGATRKCVVLVVSGRPQVLTDQIGKMDALVASWLPGSEGAGVADVLFGERRFTGKLSMTSPRSEDQVPINVGDRHYRPLFPYGWGLRTK